MAHSPCLQASSRSPIQVVHIHLWNLIVNCCVHKNSPAEPTLSHKNSVHTLTSLICILTAPLYLHLLALRRGVFSSGLPTKIVYSFMSSPMRTTCPAHLIFPYLIVLMIFYTKSTNYGAPHYAVLSSLLSVPSC
jgi:hypothetical protein